MSDEKQEQQTAEQLLKEAAAPKVFEVKLDNGQVYRSDTQEGLIAELAKAQNHASEAIRTRNEENKQLREQVNERQSAPKPKEEDSGKFDRDRYHTLFAEDPLLAQDYLTAHRLGLPMEDVREIETVTIRNATEAGVVLQTSLFTGRNTDFPDTQEAADALYQKLGSRHVTADNMDLAWMEMKRDGYKVKEASGVESGEEAPRRNRAAPPRIESTSSPNIDIMEAAHNMSPEKLAAVIEKLERQNSR